LIIDTETNLTIGDPEKIPFEIGQEINIDRLQENIKKRLKFGIASPSGIRQIFDSTYGDELADDTNGAGESITDAGKIHIATIADSFSKLLKEKYNDPIKVVVAIDSRHTGTAIADIIIRIFVHHGIEVKYTFITPITECAVYSRESSNGFIYISASHNPKGYNGLKLGLDDGRLLPSDLANNFIKQYQSRLQSKQNTLDMIAKLRESDTYILSEIYNKVPLYRKESRSIYAKFSDMLITGTHNYKKAIEIKEQLKKEIKNRNIWIGIDYNGGARNDKEYLESWGFNVYEINNRPRIDMVHDLSPIPEACKQASDELIKMQNEGKNIVAFFVYDTDGDRKNIIIPDGIKGAIIPGVQMIFVLDVLSAILNIKLSSEQNQKLAVVVNDATSSIIEQLAEYLDFIVKRVEVGEANVATAGINLSKQGINVPIMGEGSNGSVFNLDLLVREPLLTIKTLINFITKPELTKYLLKALGSENTCDDWHSQSKIRGLFINIINSLPSSKTTDFFTDEGIRKGDHELPLDIFKDNFDKYFESKLWEGISEKISQIYQGRAFYEFVNCEGQNELRGYGNRVTQKGGYKIEFYIYTSDNIKRHIGWIWFRASATELGIIRKGVSISHWQASSDAQKQVNMMYEYIDKTFSDALDEVEKITLKGIC
jgi:phosphoglucomutase